MKSAVLIGLVVLLMLIGWAFLSLPFAPNIGLRFGYWGELNQSLAWIRNRPNVRIDDVGCHTDLSLESFRIRVTVDNRHQALLSFHEGQADRGLLLRDATHIVFECILKPGQDCGEVYSCARIIKLDPGNILEEKTECDIRSVAEVFDNFGMVASIVDTLPFAIEQSLEEQWELKNQTLYMSISCPSLGL